MPGFVLLLCAAGTSLPPEMQRLLPVLAPACYRLHRATLPTEKARLASTQGDQRYGGGMFETASVIQAPAIAAGIDLPPGSSGVKLFL